MKEVLEYSREELEALSDEELELLLHESEDKESYYDTEQMTLKILMNSLYGALSNKWFPLFNEEMAAAITGNGRFYIQKMAEYIENELQRLLPQEKEYIVYGDTDSCVGNTLVTTDQGKIKIEDLYNVLSGEIEVRGQNNFIKHVGTPIKAASVSKHNELQFNKINYVMKHKVKKRMFKIKCNGDEVVITEDHSVIVFRNEQLVSVKPLEIKETDQIIKIK